MCLAAIPVLASAIGTAVSFQSGMQQAKTAEKIADRNARMQELKGAYDAKQIKRKLTYTQSQARVSASANGVGLGGSFLDVLADNEVQGRIDAANVGINARNGAQSTRVEGAAQAARGKNGAVGQLIAGIGQTADQFMKVAA